MADWMFPKSDDGSLRGFALKIRAKLVGGEPTDDNKYPVRLIEKEIRDKYYLAQKQEDEYKESRGDKPSDQRKHPFPCLKLEDSSDFFCKCTGSGGKFKRVKLPKFIEWQGASYISYLGNTDMDIPFSFTENVSKMNAQISFVNRPMYFIAGEYAYVGLPFGFEGICQVTVIGIPEDPMATSGPCFDIWSTKWNIPGYLRAIVEQNVIQALNPMIATSQGADIRNNSQFGNQNPTITT